MFVVFAIRGQWQRRDKRIYRPTENEGESKTKTFVVGEGVGGECEDDDVKDVGSWMRQGWLRWSWLPNLATSLCRGR